MSLSHYSTSESDAEFGTPVWVSEQQPSPQGTEGVARGRGLDSPSASEHQSLPRDAASGGVSLPGSSASESDVEIGIPVLENEQQPSPQGIEGVVRGRGLDSPSASEHQSLPRDAVSGGVRLPDKEIEALWKFSYKNQPCPSRNDVANRWKLLELAEKFWKDEATYITSRLDRAKDDALSTNNELYQILGFYSVFQGLLVGATCQSQKLKCESRDPVLVLCGIITLFTTIGFFLKFHEYLGKKKYAEEQQRKRNYRKSQISRLRQLNLEFQFVAPTSQEEPSIVWIFIIRAALLILPILIFSAAVTLCINWILCWQ